MRHFSSHSTDQSMHVVQSPCARGFQRLKLAQQRLTQPALQQQLQQRQVHAQAVQVDLLLGGISGVPGWVLGGVLLIGVVLGLAIAKMASNQLRSEVDLNAATLENAELRTKVCLFCWCQEIPTCLKQWHVLVSAHHTCAGCKG